MRGSRVATISGAIVLGVCLEALGAPVRRIDVATGAELEAAVSDPANARTVVRLAPGTYVLTAPLRLQPGMTLAGSEQRRDSDRDGVPDLVGPGPNDYAVAGTATVIDGSGLAPVVAVRVDCAGLTSARREPIIHLGARNWVRNLTLLSGSGVGLGEPAALVDPEEPLDVTISNTVITSTSIAVSFANSGCAARDAHSRLTFMRNVIWGAANGLVLENNLTGDAADTRDDGPVLTADVSWNRFLGNGNAMVVRASALSTDGATLNLRSMGNVFIGNRGNIFALGAFNTLAQAAVGNHLELSSCFDLFGATPTPSPAPTTAGGGIFIAGANGGATAGAPVANTVDATIRGARFVRDAATDQAEIAVYGAQRGRDNHVEVQVLLTSVRSSAGVRTRGTLAIQNEVVPDAPPSTARLIGSPRGFAIWNPDFNAPAAEFFQAPRLH